MKHRLKDLLVAVPFLVALLISNVGGVLPASLGMPKAAAASTGSFILYNPNSGSDLASIKKALADNDENNSTLAKTQMQVKGGVFGNTPVAMNYSADNSGCAQAGNNNPLALSFCANLDTHFGGQDANLYVYNVQYICEPGKGLVQSAGNNASYTINLAASVDLAGDRGNLIKNNKLNSSVNMHWINFTSVKYVSKNTPGTVQQSKDITKTSEVPNECMPPIQRTAFSGEVSENGGHNVNTTISVKPLSEAPATAGGGATAGGATGGTNESPSCESNGSVLGWLLCPIINGVADALNSLYSGLIQPLLRTRPLNLTPNSGDPNKTYDVWNNFRIYGNVLLVIVLLIVVFGESIGGGLIDAYTARKILPRLLIGAILINLSIYIVAFGMDVANILGNGLQSLIQAPFQAGNAFKLNIFGASPGFSDDALGIVGVIGGLWTVAAVWGPISFLMLFILVPTLIVMALIVGILLVRQGLILLLIFAAPIAFALWCLPNTEQYFKRWWDTLFRTLLIYPIVAVIFAMANVLSVTISNTTSSLKVFSGLLAVICLFAPLYLIPFAFQIAGGIMGTLGNLGKRVSAGGMGWAKGARGNIAKQNIEGMKTRAKAGNYLRTAREDGRGIRNRLNRGIQTGAIYGEAKRELGTRGVLNRSDFNGVRTSVEGAHMREMYDKNAAVAAVKSDSTLLRATAHGDGSKASIREYLRQNGGFTNDEDLENATSKAHRARRVLGRDLARRTAAAGQMGTTDGHIGGSSEAALAISAASQGDLTKYNEDVAWGRQLATQSGRVDLLAGHGAYLDARESIVNAGDEAGVQALMPDLRRNMATSAGNSITPQSMASADAGAAGRLGEALNENLQTQYSAWEGEVAGGDEAAIATAWEGVAQAAAPVMSVYDTMSYAKAETARALQQSLTSQDINSITPSGQPMVRGGTAVVDQAGAPVQTIAQVPVSTWLDQVRNDETIRTYRREGSSPGARAVDDDGNPIPTNPVSPRPSVTTPTPPPAPRPSGGGNPPTSGGGPGPSPPPR